MDKEVRQLWGKIRKNVIVTLVCPSLGWMLWTWFGLGAKYFAFLPEVWYAPPWWDVFGLMLLGNLILRVLGPWRVRRLDKEKGA